MSTIKVDTITDEAGTGAPTFSQGAAVTGNLTATGTITGGAFSGSGAGLTGIDAFKPVAVTGATPSLDVGSYNFFKQSTITADTTVSFTNVPTNAKWSYTFKPALVSGSWDISTGIYQQEQFSISTQESSPQGIAFKTDGTKMYIIGTTGDDVNEYDLSTAWDVTTASYSQNFSVSAQESVPVGIFFKPDGTKFYVLGSTGDDVNEYNLSTSWDVSSALYSQNFSIASQENSPGDLFFKPDGSKMYVVGNTGDKVYEYNLSTAWDISTASFLQDFSVSAQEIAPNGVFFKPDGSKMYVIGNSGDDVNEYDLSTAWDISTASYSQNFSVAAQTGSPRSIFFKPEGDRMYVLGSDLQYVSQYKLGSVSSLTLPASVENSPSQALIVNKRVTYDFFTMDGGTTVTLIGEEVV